MKVDPIADHSEGENQCKAALALRIFGDTPFMQIEYDPAKRDRTLSERGLDFEAIVQIFDGLHIIRPDDRKDYREPRYIMLGLLDDRPVVCVWTPRGDAIRVIPMRHAHDEECEKFWRELDRSG
ncbi:BrnT family toxin [Sphingobium sufflavum]|uniref:BrnT family toxin n=1 Tax=Sphingobium sufflavum TaxID=1129547 RepID=UPI001F1D6630|nr:BrnT family toxin [Sphingobium sufflavum]MCE7798653.1 BrnT family toxin [Sphingobium sufflavum]